MEALIPDIARQLNCTLSSDKALVTSATEELDRLSRLPDFPLALIFIAKGGNNQGEKIAAATYLKNFTKHHYEGDLSFLKVHRAYRNQLAQALLEVEPTVLKILVEAFRMVVASDFVKENSWPELVPELRSAIQNSNIFSESAHHWKTVNALTILQTVLKPFQYFLNPKVAKEPVPPLLDLIAQDILVPLLAAFSHLVDKALSTQSKTDPEIERTLYVICKCIYFAVRSHMPSALVPLLIPFCQDLIRILDSLKLEAPSPQDSILLKAGKRSLLIFCALVTRHRKNLDRLMPNLINCALRIVKQSPYVPNLDFLSERVISLAFDFISHTLETGPGWRLVSPHFPFLLECAIFPALVMNPKDILEWETDADEYIRKNLPSELEEFSGWKEDLFTARKSAINLLGIISMSKGPPTVTSGSTSSAKRKKGEKNKLKNRFVSAGDALVMPFLSKFPIPSDAVTLSETSNNYYGVLMAYGSLQDFLREKDPELTATLVRTRVLPLYTTSSSLRYLVATANWIIGELAPCLPDEMSADIYFALLHSLTMHDVGLHSCYPVRASAGGAIAALLENDYLPSEWLPLLQLLVRGMDCEDENESALLFQLLTNAVEAGSENLVVHIPTIVENLAGVISKHIPPIPEPWPQVVEKGFGALATMAKTWEGSLPDEMEENDPSQDWRSSWEMITKIFTELLQQAWFTTMVPVEGQGSATLPTPSGIDDASVLLGSVLRYTVRTAAALDSRISDLLVVWADLIADWHAWEEMEDLSIFDLILDVVNLHSKYVLKNFLVRQVPPPPAAPVTPRSIIEGMGAFVVGGLSTYQSATWRACSSAHLLLNAPKFSFETEGIKQSLAIAFSKAAFSRFKMIESKPVALWKPLLLVISTCYMCYPDVVERILEKEEKNGFTVWAHALGYIYNNSFGSGFSSESEVKLAVMALTKVVERMVTSSFQQMGETLNDCFVSLMKAVIHMKEVQDKEEDDDDGPEDLDNDDDADEEIEEDEDSEDEHEETEEEFLQRYAKVAAELEEGMVTEEGDLEDQVQQLELGALCEVDHLRAVFYLMERYHQALQTLILPRQLVATFVDTFPQFASFFQTMS
ncbi:importin beta-like SAD2 homolog isoform X2 [Aristolochia californica]|uniref:importin beta-like SAD2 homolog isoform X2 n=1 Tax=Aristolochia californica TaxID=171875 RepID=UPI0035E00D4D